MHKITVLVEEKIYYSYVSVAICDLLEKVIVTFEDHYYIVQQLDTLIFCYRVFCVFSFEMNIICKTGQIVWK